MSTQGLFGGGAAGDEQKAKAQDFINRYQTGNPSEGYSEQEAVQALEEVSKVATPQQMEQAFQQSVAALPDDERAQFNQMLQQRQAGQGMIDIERSGERVEVDPGQVSAGGAAPAAPDMGSLGDILGGLLGGMSGVSASPDAGAQASGDSGGGLGDLLGGLLNSPAGKAVLAGTAAFAMKEVLGQDK